MSVFISRVYLREQTNIRTISLPPILMVWDLKMIFIPRKCDLYTRACTRILRLQFYIQIYIQFPSLHIHVTHAWSCRVLDVSVLLQQTIALQLQLVLSTSPCIEAVAFSFLQTPQSRFLLLPLLIVRLSLLIRKLKKMATWFCLEQL